MGSDKHIKTRAKDIEKKRAPQKDWLSFGVVGAGVVLISGLLWYVVYSAKNGSFTQNANQQLASIIDDGNSEKQDGAGSAYGLVKQQFEEKQNSASNVNVDSTNTQAVVSTVSGLFQKATQQPEVGDGLDTKELASKEVGDTIHTDKPKPESKPKRKARKPRSSNRRADVVKRSVRDVPADTTQARVVSAAKPTPTFSGFKSRSFSGREDEAAENNSKPIKEENRYIRIVISQRKELVDNQIVSLVTQERILVKGKSFPKGSIVSTRFTVRKENKELRIIFRPIKITYQTRSNTLSGYSILDPDDMKKGKYMATFEYKDGNPVVKKVGKFAEGLIYSLVPGGDIIQLGKEVFGDIFKGIKGKGKQQKFIVPEGLVMLLSSS